MKMVKMQILLVAVLLSNGLSLQGMAATRRAAAIKSGKLSTVKTQPRFKSEKIKIKPVEEKQEEEQQSWGSWFKSLLTPKTSTILTSEEIDRLLEGDFDENALEEAEQKLGSMIDQNDEYKKLIIGRGDLFLIGCNRFQQTILDKVLSHFFDEKYSGGVFTPSASSLNYIKLIQYLIDKGAYINPENLNLWHRNIYKEAYFELIKSYENLYGSEPRTIYGVDFEIQMFKEIFQELDPILEQLIPYFAEWRREAENRRAKVERENPFVGEKALEDDRNKQEYMTAKRDYFFNDYQERTGSYPDFEIGFDKKEYRDWLTKNKDKYFFEKPQFVVAPRSHGGDRGEYLRRELIRVRNRMTELLDIPATASEEEIGDVYRNLVRQYYSDMAKNPNDLMLLKLREEINPTWDLYKRILEKIEEEKEGRE